MYIWNIIARNTRHESALNVQMAMNIIMSLFQISLNASATKMYTRGLYFLPTAGIWKKV